MNNSRSKDRASSKGLTEESAEKRAEKDLGESMANQQISKTSISEGVSVQATANSEALTAEQALAQILAHLSPIAAAKQSSANESTESLPLLSAHQRILAHTITSDIDVPSFRNSAMDGYACRRKDVGTGAALELIGRSLAGHPFTGIVGAQQCIRITTGAQVPDELDTVIIQENTSVEDTVVRVIGGENKESFVRDQGSNIKKGLPLLHAGTRIGPAEMGLLASIGHRNVDVLRKIRVAIFSTGDELVEIDSVLAPGQIHDSNRYLLTGLLNDSALDVIDLGIQSDSREALSACMAKAKLADVAISSGGVSVGDADYVREVLEMNGTLHIWKILMKPGKPLVFGQLDSGTVYFGLPGNPVSGMVTFSLFVQPALQKILGLAQQPRPEISAICTTELRKQAGRMEFQRGILVKDGEERWVVSSTGMQDSHVLTSMSRANCYIELPINSTGAAVGEPVKVIPF